MLQPTDILQYYIRNGIDNIDAMLITTWKAVMNIDCQYFESVYATIN